MKLEKTIEKECCDYALLNGIVNRKIEYISKKGCPDRIFIGDNILFFVEFKKSGGILSKFQIEEIEILRRSGIKVYVVYNFKQFKEIIEECIK